MQRSHPPKQPVSDKKECRTYIFVVLTEQMRLVIVIGHARQYWEPISNIAITTRYVH